MKKLLLLFTFLASVVVVAQNKPDYSVKVEAVKWRGSVTTEIRDQYVVPIGEHWELYNTDTNTKEIWNGTEWISVSQSYTAGTGLDLTGTVFSLGSEALTFGRSLNTYNPADNNIPQWYLQQDFQGTTKAELAFEYGTSAIKSYNVSSSTSVTANPTSVSIVVGSENYIYDGTYDSDNDVAQKKDVDAAIASLPAGSNDFVTGGSLAGNNLTLNVQNQTDPTIDISGVRSGLMQLNDQSTNVNTSDFAIWAGGSRLYLDPDNDTASLRGGNPSSVNDTYLNLGPNSAMIDFQTGQDVVFNPNGPTNPNDAVTLGYFNANVGSGGNANATKDPLDDVVTAATLTLSDTDSHFQSGGNQGRKRIIRKDNGRLDIEPGASLEVGQIFRFSTRADNDIIALRPANNYVLDWDGKTGSQNAASITGRFGEMYARVASSDTITLHGPALTGYTYTDYPTPLHRWSPSDSNTSVWNDEIGSLNGTVSGTVNVVDTGGGVYERRFAGGYIDFPTDNSVNPTLGTDEFTIVVKTGTVVGTTGYFASNRGPGAEGWGVLIPTAGSGFVAGMAGGTFTSDIAHTHQANAVYVLVVRANGMDLWVDGTKVVDNASIGSTVSSGSMNFGGRTDGSYLYNGSLKLVEWHSSALSDVLVGQVFSTHQEN